MKHDEPTESPTVSPVDSAHLTPLDRFLRGLEIARQAIMRASFYNSEEMACFTLSAGLTPNEVARLESLGWEYYYSDLTKRGSISIICPLLRRAMPHTSAIIDALNV